MVSVARGVHLDACRSYASGSMVKFLAPPEELEDRYFERPTPILLVAGEGQSTDWWGGTASFFAARGCTVGSMTLTGRGKSPTETLTLRALQAGVSAAVDGSGLTPPVIVAHSMAGFVCQQFLQSYSASGLVLLDSFPPNPSALAIEHLKLAQAGQSLHADHPATAVDTTTASLSVQELAHLIKEDPARCEGLLSRHFEDFHRRSPWQASTLLQQGDQAQASPPAESHLSSGNPSLPPSRFPAKAFSQMCLGLPSSTLRLERHVVQTLVLGSKKGHVKLSGGGDVAAVEMAEKVGLEAISDFHRADGWGLIDCDGRVEVSSGMESWQEAVWEWYDARF
eukprot:jgi/Undpi1/13036/HiC_scaffold_8.g02699.m1